MNIATGIMGFFRLTTGKNIVLIAFLLASMLPSSIFRYPALQFDVITQFQLILLIPLFLLNLPALSYAGLVVWLVYIYVVDCVYVNAYNYIDAKFRKQFPGLNRGWGQKKTFRFF